MLNSNHNLRLSDNILWGAFKNQKDPHTNCPQKYAIVLLKETLIANRSVLIVLYYIFVCTLACLAIYTCMSKCVCVCGSKPACCSLSSSVQNQNQPDAEPTKQEKVIEIESDIKLKNQI